jgi:hypothetical protein
MSIHRLSRCASASDLTITGAQRVGAAVIEHGDTDGATGGNF